MLKLTGTYGQKWRVDYRQQSVYIPKKSRNMKNCPNQARGVNYFIIRKVWAAGARGWVYLTQYVDQLAGLLFFWSWGWLWCGFLV